MSFTVKYGIFLILLFVIISVIWFRWFVLFVAYTSGLFLLQGVLFYITRGRTISFTMGTSAGFGVIAATFHVAVTYLLK